MSTRNNHIRLLGDLRDLLFPPLCPVCGRPMGDGMEIICNTCRWEMPLTGFISQFDNPMTRRLWGLIPIEHASALFYYIDGSDFRKLIHGFKYGGRWNTARSMGEWMGHEMARSGIYETVDVIIPVPLHLLRRLKRGYNQSEYLAEGIARILERPVDRKAVVRHRYNDSQTRQSKHDRWDNVKGIFRVRHPERLAGKHLLLVDDVFTTGATICACAEAILAAAPDCRISVATLAVSKHEIAGYF